jgi:hypothetical protein
MKRLSPEQLVSLVGKAMHDEELRRNLARMKERIEAENSLESAIEMIEAAGRSRPRLEPTR